MENWQLGDQSVTVGVNVCLCLLQPYSDFDFGNMFGRKVLDATKKSIRLKTAQSLKKKMQQGILLEVGVLLLLLLEMMDCIYLTVAPRR